MRAVCLLFVAALCFGPLACSGGDDVTIQGAGATFPAPLYKRWFLEFYKQNPTVRVNYTPIGSGAGIRQFTTGLINFGASDAGMSNITARVLWNHRLTTAGITRKASTFVPSEGIVTGL